MPDLYLPIPLVEAFGRAAVAFAELELSFDILLTVLRGEEGRFDLAVDHENFENKLKSLAAVRHSRLLKHEWWREVRVMASRGRVLDQQYSAVKLASIYSRGAGTLERLIRPLADRTGLVSRSMVMTPTKLDTISEAARELALAACRMANLLLEASERLSINLSTLPPSTT